jgi:sugar phosphate isomerase/epimerase
LNWNLVHEAIGALVAPSRLNNSYCKVPSLQNIDRNVERIRNGEISDNSGDRYQSFNLQSFSRYGTLEIRVHQGTLNGTKAVAWAKFIDAFKDYSATNLITLDDLGVNDRLNKCESLLNILMLAGKLDSATGQYLKDRAATIQG